MIVAFAMAVTSVGLVPHLCRTYVDTPMRISHAQPPARLSVERTLVSPRPRAVSMLSDEPSDEKRLAAYVVARERAEKLAAEAASQPSPPPFWNSMFSSADEAAAPTGGLDPTNPFDAALGAVWGSVDGWNAQVEKQRSGNAPPSISMPDALDDELAARVWRDDSEERRRMLESLLTAAHQPIEEAAEEVAEEVVEEPLAAEASGGAVEYSLSTDEKIAAVEAEVEELRREVRIVALEAEVEGLRQVIAESAEDGGSASGPSG